MNLRILLNRRQTGVDPIALDSECQSKLRSWEAGFDAYEKGWPIEGCNVPSRSRPLWREGWHAAKRMEELAAERGAM